MSFHPNQFPMDVWEQIAYYFLARDDTFLGLLPGLTSLLLTCRWIHDSLSYPANPRLYARLFCSKFDIAAPRRRLSDRWFTAPCLAVELRKRFTMMQRVRRQADYAVQDMWTCYLMMLENDGRNERQLEWAGLSDYISHCVSHRLPAATTTSSSSVYDTESISLLLWLSWMTSTKDRLRSESSSVRTWWTDKFLHRFLAAGFKFPSFYAPDSFLHLPISQNVDPMPPVISGPSPSVKKITHFSRPLAVSAPLLTAAALLSWMVRQEHVLAAQPLDLESFSEIPPTRAAAIALNRQGPTLEDILAYREQRVACPHRNPVPSRAPWDAFDIVTCATQEEEQEDEDNEPDEDLIENASEHERDFCDSRYHEADWYRTVSCVNMFSLYRPLRGVVFSPGSLTGRWAGQFLFTSMDHYLRMLQGDTRVDANSVPMLARPLYWDLQEHHCLQPTEPLSPGADEYEGDDVLNAWLPRGFSLTKRESAIDVSEPFNDTRRTVRYHTYCPDGPSNAPYSKSATQALRREWMSDGCNDEEIADETDEAMWPIDVDTSWPVGDMADQLSATTSSEGYIDTVSQRSSGVADILVTGETGPLHGEAWGHYTVVGRVRSWDGLVVLLSQPKNPAHVALGKWVFKGYLHGNNLVGRWRETTTAAGLVGYEGPFVVSRHQ